MVRQSGYILRKNKKGNSLQYALNGLMFAQLSNELKNYGNTAHEIKIAKEIIEEKLSIRHPYYGKANAILSQSYLEAGYIKKGSDMLSDALHQLSFSLGKSHPWYIENSVKLIESTKHSDKKENIAAAIDTFKSLMGEKHYLLAELYRDYGNFYFKKGEYSKAEKYHQYSLNLKKELLSYDHPLYLKSLIDNAILFWAKKDYNRAYFYFEESITQYQQNYKAGFAFLSEDEKSLFYAEIKEFYEKFYQFVLEYKEQNRQLTGQVYDLQLFSKGLLFNSSKELKEELREHPDLKKKFERWIRTKELLSKAYKLEKSSLKKQLDTDSLENVANFLEKELSLRLEIDKSKKKIIATEEVDWQLLKSHLKENEVAIEIIRSRHFKPDSGGDFTEDINYIAAILTPNKFERPILIHHANGKMMESKGIKFYKNTIKYGLKEGAPYDLFWKKIADHPSVKKANIIFYSPDGVYNQINLNSLYDEEEKHYVIEKHDIYNLSNTKDLIEVEHGVPFDTKASTMLLGYPAYNKSVLQHIEETLSHTTDGQTREFRAPDFLNGFMQGGSGVSMLPGTKSEIDTINDILHDHMISTEKHLFTDAREEHFKKFDTEYTSPSIIHIATHGFFVEPHKKNKNDESLVNEDVSPLNHSGILLSNAAYAQHEEIIQKEIEAWEKDTLFDDGILTAYEAMNLDLINTQLIVLSACETGLGVVKNGEGVYGLQRSFQTAGASAVIMSLWKVHDEATMDFMTTFYEEWFRLNDKRKAFISTQKKMLDKYELPIYWAPFVMTGV